MFRVKFHLYLYIIFQTMLVKNKIVINKYDHVIECTIKIFPFI